MVPLLRGCGPGEGPSTISGKAPTIAGTVALVDQGARFLAFTVGVRSDRCGEFIECCGDAEPLMAGFDVEFVVAASQVLDERVTADHR